MTSELPTDARIVAVLLTDVVSSTQHLTHMGDEAWNAERGRHFGLLRDELTRHDGVEVKNTGDGILAVFPSAVDAVRAAAAMQQAVERVSGGVLWANLHLLFWLSLFPFVTAWIGESGFLAWPLALYGLVLLMAAVAYYILTRALLAVHGPDSGLARALGRDIKGRGSILLYAVAISLAFFIPWATGLLYWLAAMIWLIPDRRMEAILPG